MKKITGLFFGLVISLVVSAQTAQQDWLVGGSFALNTSRNTTVSLNPAAGYFFLNNFAAGGVFQLSYNKSGENKTTVFGVGPFVRYYFGKKELKPFIASEYIFTSNKFDNPSFRSTVNGADFFIGPGLAAFVNEHVAIETLVGYVNSKVSDVPSDGGVVVRIGFQIYLSPRGIVDTYRKR
jgi:hypothetical protein